MDLYRSLDVVMDSNWSLWALMYPYVFLWFLMGPYRSFASFGSLCVLMRPYCLLWVFNASL